MAFYTPDYGRPGAKERIEERLKELPRINKERPCPKCTHYDRSYLIKCRSTIPCNFSHDQFKERTPQFDEIETG